MIIFLYGPDTFRSRQKLNALKEKFISEVDKAGLNLTRLDGATLETASFRQAISAPPFLAKKRMVIIEDLIAKNKGQKIQKEILEILSSAQLDTTILIFWEGDLGAKSKKKSRSKTAARRSHLLLDRLRDEKYAQDFALLEPAAVKRWASTEVKNRGGEIEPAALQQLTDATGNDLWQLTAEIDKLIAYSQAKKITSADIALMVTTKLGDDIFRLTDALGQKNKPLALRLAAEQLQSGTSPTELLNKVIWQFKNLLLISSFIENNGGGYSAERLSYQLHLHPFVIKKTLSQIKHHSGKELKKTYQRLLAIEYKIKTSQIDPEVLFDLLIVKS